MKRPSAFIPHPSSFLFQTDPALFQGVFDDVGLAFCLEFSHNIGAMSFYGFDADGQGLADFSG